MLATSERIRAMIAECHTEADVVKVLRSHKVKYSFTTDTGYMSIRIPCRKGCVRVYRTCSRSAPLMIRAGQGVPFRYPLFSPNY